MRRKLVAPVSVAASLLLVAAATPVFAASPDDAADSANAIAQIAPDVLELAVSADTMVSSADSRIASTDSAEITLPVDPGDPITYRVGTEKLEITLPVASESADAKVVDGLVAYDNRDGSTTVPIPQEDGSLQISTVISGPSSPSAYTYELGLPAGYELVPSDVGAGIGIAAADQSDLLGVFAAPWATDSNGQSVPTHYEIQGTNLVQVVDHSAADYTYPIVADPWLNQDLYYSPSLTSWNGAFKVNVIPRQHGQDWAGIATWWAHADEVNDKLAARYPTRPASQRWNDNVQEQLYCHIAGLPLSLPEYNLEAARTFLYWESQVIYKCNYPEGYFSG